MKKKHICFVICCLICGSLFLSCKDDFLSAKYDKRKNVPATLKDYQALLDNTTVFNANLPVLGEFAGDDYELLYARWQTLSNLYKDSYIWSGELANINEDFTDWNEGFRKVYTANVVLEGLQSIKLNDENKEERNLVKGSALFFRGASYFQLAQEFCKQYTDGGAISDGGLPVRLTSDLNIRVGRSNLQDTYKQLIKDLLESVTLLPKNVPVKTRPSKAAAYGMLARVYLQIGQYDKAVLYTDSCLEIQHELQNFNQLDIAASFPFSMFNKEVILHQTVYSIGATGQSTLLVSEALYNAYETNDLRKTAYYKASGTRQTFKGAYTGSTVLFGGITTAEIWLIRAESNARLSRFEAASNDLRLLLENRYKDGIVHIEAQDAAALLKKIKNERRKELVFRGIRWADIRRYNALEGDGIGIVRNLNGEIYELKPLDERFVFPFPKAAIDLGGY